MKVYKSGNNNPINMNKLEKYNIKINNYWDTIDDINLRICDINNLSNGECDYFYHKQFLWLKKELYKSMTELALTSLFIIVVNNLLTVPFVSFLVACFGLTVYTEKAKKIYKLCCQDMYQNNPKLTRKTIRNDFLVNVYYSLWKKITTIKYNHYIRKTDKINKKIYHSNCTQDIKDTAHRNDICCKYNRQTDLLNDLGIKLYKYKSSLSKHYQIDEMDNLQMIVSSVINIVYHIALGYNFLTFIPHFKLPILVANFLYFASGLLLTFPVLTGLLKSCTYDVIQSYRYQGKVERAESKLLELEKEVTPYLEDDMDNIQTSENIDHTQERTQSIAPVNHELDSLGNNEVKKRTKK